MKLTNEQLDEWSNLADQWCYFVLLANIPKGEDEFKELVRLARLGLAVEERAREEEEMFEQVLEEIAASPNSILDDLPFKEKP